LYLLEEGKLVSGDYLILDNCGIHGADESWGTLYTLLEAAGVSLIFLPTYSPEFNPCELVFAQVKNYLRHHRTSAPFDREILNAFSAITFMDLYLMYMQCIWMDFLDPVKY